MAGDAAKIALEASGVRKSFSKDGRSLAVLDVERFTVRDGEFVTVIGPSGCGKSTLLHIMGGFIQAEAGAIQVHGRRVNGPGPDRGMMFQEFALFPWKTVAGNVAWGLETQGLSKGRLQKIVDEHLTGKRDHTLRLWQLVVFERWHRLYVDRSAGSAVEGARSVLAR